MSPNSADDSANQTQETRETNEPRSSIAKIAVWDFAGKLANFFVLFVVGVVLTRLLSPSEFGAFAIVLAVISFSSIFLDLGFRASIIQNQNMTDRQLSTVFYLNLAIAVVLIGCFFAAAGYIESFYQIEGLGNYIWAASLLFGINALALVPGGLLQKELELKTLSIINTIAAALSGAIAIGIAMLGYGVWALVAQQLISAGLILVGVFVMSGWRPAAEFSLSSINELWQYGIRIFLAGLSDTIFSRLDIFIIGKLFPIQTLGFYNRAQSLDNLVKNFAASTTTSVAFPVIARMADDIAAVRAFYKRCLNVISFLSFLLIGVLFLTCFDIVIILFTETWTDVGYYFRIMAVTAFVYPISALMVNLIAARGNSAAYLKLELIKKCILFPTYLSFFFGGVFTFLIVLGVSFLLGLALNVYFVTKEIKIPVGEQLWAIYKYGIIATVGTAAVFFATLYIDNLYLHMIAATAMYSATYLLFCYKLKLSGFFEIHDRAVGFYDAKRNANISTAD